MRVTREEVSLQSTLGHAESRGDWELLTERGWAAQEEIIRVSNDSKHAYYDTHQMVRMFVDELKQGFERGPRVT